MEELERYVIKRDNSRQVVNTEKIKVRIQRLMHELNDDFINLDVVVKKVSEGIHSGVSTAQLDNLAAETCAYMNIVHPDYSKLAARISVSNLHKMTKTSFFEVIHDLYTLMDTNNNPSPLIASDVYFFIKNNQEALESSIDFFRDFSYDYFGFKTLEKSYLLKINGRIVERPQHMLMRVSAGIHTDNLEATIQTYNLMSQK